LPEDISVYDLWQSVENYWMDQEIADPEHEEQWADVERFSIP
jgi:hypothetical protein